MEKARVRMKRRLFARNCEMEGRVDQGVEVDQGLEADLDTGLDDAESRVRGNIQHMDGEERVVSTGVLGTGSDGENGASPGRSLACMRKRRQRLRMTESNKGRERKEKRERMSRLRADRKAEASNAMSES